MRAAARPACALASAPAAAAEWKHEFAPYLWGPAMDGTGQVAFVGMDAIRPVLEFVKEGIIESSVATIPAMQGSMAILTLWQASLGAPMPQRVDTGIDLVTRENVDSFLTEAR